MASIFHIIARSDAETAKLAGVYRPASLLEEGFIHCSYANQVCRVANFMNQGDTNLVLLEIDVTLVTSAVVDEDLYNFGESFPHIYGELHWSSVLAIHAFPCKDSGFFNLPASLSEPK